MCIRDSFAGDKLNKLHGLSAQMLVLGEEEHTNAVFALVAMKLFELVTRKEGLEFLAWRKVPVDPDAVGQKARDCMPAIWQCFIKKPAKGSKGIDFDRKLYIVRRVFEQAKMCIRASSHQRAHSVNGSLPLYVSQVLQLGLRLRPMERIQTVPQLYQALSSKEYTAELTRTMKPETPVRTAQPCLLYTSRAHPSCSRRRGNAGS